MLASATRWIPGCILQRRSPFHLQPQQRRRTAVEDLASSGGTALMVGTGLMVRSHLFADTGHLVALSRRPAPRLTRTMSQLPSSGTRPDMQRSVLLRWLRRRRSGWKCGAAIGLRPYSHAIWQSLDVDQQRRFAPCAAVVGHTATESPRRLVPVARLVAEALEMCGQDPAFVRPAIKSIPLTEDPSPDPTFAYAFNCTGHHSWARTKNRWSGLLMRRSQAIVWAWP